MKRKKALDFEDIDRFSDENGGILKTEYGEWIRPKNESQKRLLEALDDKSVIFAIGPAGSGKTYMAMAWALRKLMRKETAKIVVSRPIVEAGERLGYLPGNLKEKIDPYLRPIFDFLEEMVGLQTTETLISKNVIEISPLAYMRGRTFKNCAVILDEAQNATYTQIKMLLTRMGDGCKMIITGDPGQVDLPKAEKSGLYEAENILSEVEEAAFVKFCSSDVVRSVTTQKIVEAYQRYENRKNEKIIPFQKQ